MSKESDSVLFKKDSGESLADIWDDTALIRAYERSVKNIKEKLDSKLVISSKETRKDASKVSEQTDKDSDAGEDISGNYEKIGKVWKILDLCSAVYSEDGLLYPAKIEEIYGDDSMPYDERKCRIQYLEYLNEEEKFLTELYEYNEDDYAAVYYEEDEEEPAVIKKSTESAKASKTEPSRASTVFSGLQMPPPPPPPPMMASLLNKAGDVGADNDALYSMLMSWYMSGYHTGYYFGRSEAQK